MQYCITMERVQRVAVWYEAANDEDAIEKGDKILEAHKVKDDVFLGGDVEYNYAISTDGGNDIIPW